MPITIERPSASSRMPERPSWLDPAEFPFQRNFIEIEGNLIHYLDEGEGPVLLLVPGAVWSFTFRDLIVRLRSSFRCITLDFPGIGLSVPSDLYRPSIKANSEILGTFVDRLGLRDIGLFVHDAGGPPGLGLAARQPELFRGLVIASTFAWPLRESPSITRMLRFVSGPIFGALDDRLDLFGRFTAGSSGAGKSLSSAGRAVLRGPSRTRDGRTAILRMLGTLIGSDAWLEDVERATRTVLRNKPVLTVFGAKNDPFGWQDRYERTFPRSRRVTVAGGGHFPFADDADAVSEAIGSWWRSLVEPDEPNAHVSGQS